MHFFPLRLACPNVPSHPNLSISVCCYRDHVPTWACTVKRSLLLPGKSSLVYFILGQLGAIHPGAVTFSSAVKLAKVDLKQSPFSLSPLTFNPSTAPTFVPSPPGGPGSPMSPFSPWGHNYSCLNIFVR